MNHKNSNDGSLRDLWLGIAISIGAYLFGSSVLGFVLGPFALLVTFIAHIAAIVICFRKGMKLDGSGAVNWPRDFYFINWRLLWPFICHAWRVSYLFC
ncbi:hypothetical protein [Neobacillus niacini]|uniref:hypothetical protein n=1 Tax=Neobacillus niacini TaxID=86668 RepID=UPI0021CB2E3F|nr:hypothetical protein [Neobacillus niacini]MCM3765679.1 hypothetical protein [Neobacillus niacini]